LEIPLNAKVECTDGICGHSEYVLINPVSDQVTHLVVKEDSSPSTEYVVPIDFVVAIIIDNMIRLSCSKAKLEKMDPFIKTTFIEDPISEDKNVGLGGGTYGRGIYYYLPYVTPMDPVPVPIEHLQIPPGELAVRRGARVEATDGYVGNVDEFVVNPENSHITHLVMREGHLWGKKDVIIPLSAMSEIREDTVFLKLDKHQIEALPTFPLNRRWS
jgi:uncharacterized protein YrrD